MPQRALYRAIAAALVLSFGCAKKDNRIILASTTSTQDSGLFGVLIPAFERAHSDVKVNVVAVGTGEALEMGKRKDADVVLVHAPAAESVFVAKGYGTNRRAVMHSDFVIVGPADDPAQIRGLQSAADAFQRIAAAQAPFVSRGDDSGTEKKELSIWKRAAIKPGGAWYARAGQGMGEVLKMSSEKQAYTLTDRPSYLFMQQQLNLQLLTEGDPTLLNPYAVIEVVGARNAAGARTFADWITSAEGQRVIGSYGVDRFRKRLFIPDAATR